MSEGTKSRITISTLVAKKGIVFAIGGFLVIGLLVLFFLKSIVGSGANALEKKCESALTAEEFRTAFNKEQPVLQIDFFRKETIDGKPWISYVFSDGSGIKLNLGRGTERVCTLMCTFTKHSPRHSGDSYTLANTVVYVLSPEANSGETWKLVDRLTRGADGSADIKRNGELFRNLSVSMLSAGKDGSGLPLLSLVFTPRPASSPEPPPKIKVIDTIPNDGTHEPGKRFAKRGIDGIKRNGYYRVTSHFPKSWNYITWKYDILRDGSLYFQDLTSNKSITVSHPYTVTEEYAGEGREPVDDK